MCAMKTPGVYIVEKNAFPNSVVEVATAIPAFIGYTKQAKDGNRSLEGKPQKINSMAEFEFYFGGAPKLKFDIKEGEESLFSITSNGKAYAIKPAEEDKQYMLYYAIQFFYNNGGGPCYIVSVGNYEKPIIEDDLRKGIIPLLKEQEPTMLVIPEAVRLAEDAFNNVITDMLKHCGNELLRNRVAVLDVHDGFKEKDSEGNSIITKFRNGVGSEFLDYAAAYYPWVNTSIVPDNMVTYKNTVTESLKTLLKEDPDLKAANEDEKKAIQDEYVEKLSDDNNQKDSDNYHNTLLKVSPLYAAIMKEVRFAMNQLPPASAMAGIYTLVDNTRGVWKAPANVSLSAAVSPTVNISHQDQEDLNMPLNGKAINALRVFTGEGLKVWGARTLDGNSMDWRYINVRRTMIMLEESIKNAARAYVFDPNDANTWVNMKSMIGNFLNGIWKRGGLAGASPDDAYSVHVGLGETMTPDDILNGILKITILVAVVRPAEFIEITFQQQMQKS